VPRGHKTPLAGSRCQHHRRNPRHRASTALHRLRSIDPASRTHTRIRARVTYEQRSYGTRAVRGDNGGATYSWARTPNSVHRPGHTETARWRSSARKRRAVDVARRRGAVESGRAHARLLRVQHRRVVAERAGAAHQSTLPHRYLATPTRSTITWCPRLHVIHEQRTPPHSEAHRLSAVLCISVNGAVPSNVLLHKFSSLVQHAQHTERQRRTMQRRRHPGHARNGGSQREQRWNRAREIVASHVKQSEFRERAVLHWDRAWRTNSPNTLNRCPHPGKTDTGTDRRDKCMPLQGATEQSSRV
jgi:hypothetical protein